MTNEESEDAKMRALFGEVARAPMGDEEFVSRVMGRVAEAKASRNVQRSTAALGMGAIALALLWPYKAAIGTALTLSVPRLTADFPILSSGAFSGSAGALLIAAAASLAALAYAERA